MDRRYALKQLSLSGLGLTLSASLVTAVQGCQPNFVPNYVPTTLNSAQDQVLLELVERIIPTTETPGAKAAGVNQYIDLVLSKVSESSDRMSFLNGLDKLIEIGFVQKPIDEQIQTLNSWERSSKTEERQFFNDLKGLTIFGYYTSEVGATQELRYAHVTGSYNGDIPYDEVGKNFY